MPEMTADSPNGDRSDAPVADEPDGPGCCPGAETIPRPSSGHETPPHGMSANPSDPAPQAGLVDALGVYALAEENDRLREVETAARETYAWLARNCLHTTAHGRGLAEALGLAEAKDEYPGKVDGA